MNDILRLNRITGEREKRKSVTFRITERSQERSYHYEKNISHSYSSSNHNNSRRNRRAGSRRRAECRGSQRSGFLRLLLLLLSGQRPLLYGCGRRRYLRLQLCFCRAECCGCGTEYFGQQRLRFRPSSHGAKPRFRQRTSRLRPVFRLSGSSRFSGRRSFARGTDNAK